MNNEIIKNVVRRTGGEIYLGVVGSVRSGKSTFIRKFMETKVLPYINDEEIYHKITDELPQSSSGKTIMTVEPKFVPTLNTTIDIENDLSIKIRLVDCVGYVIPTSKGYLNEDGTKRLVQTPWYADMIPFEEAALLGTKKVIESHSNIGVVLTSDGSFSEFTRDEYEKVEEQVIEELKNLNKPFVIVLNTQNPKSDETLLLCKNLEEKYEVKVLPISVVDMNEADVDLILKSALEEFDISEINLNVPDWINELDDEFVYKKQFDNVLSETTGTYRKMKDVYNIIDSLKTCELFEDVYASEVDSGSGIVNIDISFKEDLYKQVLEEIIGEKIDDKSNFLKILVEFKKSKVVNDKFEGCLEKLETDGYVITKPKISDLELDTPEVIKQGGRHGIKLKANAPAILMVKLNVESSFEPIIGSAESSSQLINYMLEDYQTNPEKVWNSEFFGRKLCEVINDGVKSKIDNVNKDVLVKYKNSMEKVVNNRRGSIIAIVI